MKARAKDLDAEYEDYLWRLVSVWLVFTVLAAFGVLGMWLAGCSGPQATEPEQVTQAAIHTEVDLGIASATLDVDAEITPAVKTVGIVVVITVFGLRGTVDLVWNMVTESARICFRALTLEGCRELGEDAGSSSPVPAQ
jgi:hypothetical protein